MFRLLPFIAFLVERSYRSVPLYMKDVSILSCFIVLFPLKAVLF
ncbi:hypothetical protein EMIT0P44_50040 [Pseudomonas sp. IT-P44]